MNRAHAISIVYLRLLCWDISRQLRKYLLVNAERKRTKRNTCVCKMGYPCWNQMREKRISQLSESVDLCFQASISFVQNYLFSFLWIIQSILKDERWKASQDVCFFQQQNRKEEEKNNLLKTGIAILLF